MTAAAALLPLLALSACAEDADAEETSGGGSAETSAKEAADDPFETLRRLSPLAQAEDFETACLLMANDEKTAYAIYPDLIEECATDDAPRILDDLDASEWEAVLATPEERVEESENGAGTPQFIFNDEGGSAVAVIEMYEIDGLWYLADISGD
jgi:hypothetical protein